MFVVLKIVIRVLEMVVLHGFLTAFTVGALVVTKVNTEQVIEFHHLEH